MLGPVAVLDLQFWGQWIWVATDTELEQLQASYYELYYSITVYMK